MSTQRDIIEQEWREGLLSLTKLNLIEVLDSENGTSVIFSVIDGIFYGVVSNFDGIKF